MSQRYTIIVRDKDKDIMHWTRCPKTAVEGHIAEYRAVFGFPPNENEHEGMTIEVHRKNVLKLP